MAVRVSRLVAFGVLVASVPLWPGVDHRPPAKAGEDTAAEEMETDPLSANAACYVCHIPFVKEELSRVHLTKKVTCTDCHGPSVGHANDENIGATPPDVVYKSHQIDASCGKCHKSHDAPAREVVARFLKRRLSTKSSVVCTQCHGRHKIQWSLTEEE